MSYSQITKKVLAESIKQLMETKPLAKISVGDITEHCGINRQSFYYHFKDKYDLVNWIYYTETIEFISKITDMNNWTSGVADLCIYMQENSKFYINALNTPGQNSFQEYLTQFIHDLLVSIIEEIKGQRIIEQDIINFIADFYTFAFVGVVLKWAKNGMKESPQEYIDKIKELVNKSIIKEIERY